MSDFGFLEIRYAFDGRQITRNPTFEILLNRPEGQTL